MTPAIDDLFADYSGDQPGAAVAIVRNGDVVLRKGFGLADVESHTPVTPSTNFRLASVTKQFTAAAIELLAERGVLSLDDPLGKWLPSMPEATRAITIRQILHHTSGLVDYEDLIPASQTEQVSDADVLPLLERENRVLFEPGSKWQYSNTGYVLLGLIVERASHATLGDFLEREIFAKRGMQHSVLNDRGVTIATRAYGHDREDGKWVRRDQSVTSATRGDGAIYSSVDDLVHWQPATPADTVVTDDANVRYGYGLFASGDRVWHTGSTVGFRNAIVSYPSERLTIIVLTNRNEGEPVEIAKKIADRIR